MLLLSNERAYVINVIIKQRCDRKEGGSLTVGQNKKKINQGR